ncbi:MAG: hypothetical protein EZS28_004958 [Streblomastix strix]|uniref:Uncharacterized protein n=1 Tax=Streblomastix strix TaxID=222440 RepID=A0A5J4WWU3_9EUKA|nr:MAG: hypothetical protein EZS28_004958 [Streblomastix strix]
MADIPPLLERFHGLVDVMDSHDWLHRYDQPGIPHIWRDLDNQYNSRRLVALDQLSKLTSQQSSSQTSESKNDPSQPPQISDQLICNKCQKVIVNKFPLQPINYHIQICWMCGRYICEECTDFVDLISVQKSLRDKDGDKNKLTNPIMLGRCFHCNAPLGPLSAPMKNKIEWGFLFCDPNEDGHPNPRILAVKSVTMEIDPSIMQAHQLFYKHKKYKEALLYMTRAIMCLNWIESFYKDAMYGIFSSSLYRAHCIRITMMKQIEEINQIEQGEKQDQKEQDKDDKQQQQKKDKDKEQEQQVKQKQEQKVEGEVEKDQDEQNNEKKVIRDEEQEKEQKIEEKKEELKDKTEIIKELIKLRPQAFSQELSYLCDTHNPSRGFIDPLQLPFHSLYLEAISFPLGMHIMRDESSTRHIFCSCCTGNPRIRQLGVIHKGAIQWIGSANSIAYRIMDIRFVFQSEEGANQFILEGQERLSEGRKQIKISEKQVGEQGKLVGGPDASHINDQPVPSYAYIFRQKNIVVKIYVQQGPLSTAKLEPSFLIMLAKGANAKAALFKFPSDEQISQIRAQFDEDSKLAQRISDKRRKEIQKLTRNEIVCKYAAALMEKDPRKLADLPEFLVL